ncbi:Ubiquitin carboxyl-terminal hydrolase 38 [Nymphon striatum]|nr:Ubiquitin carboxyl-terminal hydrolase 38 [Nymphon striatum]
MTKPGSLETILDLVSQAKPEICKEKMDQILNGILKSEHPESWKQKFIENLVIPAATKPLEKSTFVMLLWRACNYTLYNKSEFVRKLAFKVFVTYSENNQSIIEEFCTLESFHSILRDENVEDKQDALKIIHTMLKLVKNDELLKELILTLESDIISVSRNCQHNLLALKWLVLIMKDFSVKIFANDRLPFYEILIEAVNNFKIISIDTAERSAFVCDITTICSILKHMWASSNQTELLVCLKILYAILCREEPYSLSIASVAQVHINFSFKVFPLNDVNLSSSLIEKEITLSDENLSQLVLTRMIEWLSWPVTTNTHLWVLYLLNVLQKANKRVVIIKVTIAKIEQIADKLFIPIGRHGTFAVFSHLLLSFQHSPIAFNKVCYSSDIVSLQFLKDSVVLNRFYELIDIFKNDPKLMESLVELIHCMNHLYSGAPEPYEDLIKAISNYEAPSSQRIEELISRRKYVRRPNCRPIKVAKVLKLTLEDRYRSETGYVGLENMGNTCYMNSILQALFMTKLFFAKIMKQPYRQNGSIVSNLQHLFAFLTQSQRKYFTPVLFSQRCKPPWFQNNFQQDCSEFLRHFLDILHEEEINSKKNESIVQNTFFGKIQTDFKCLECNTISSNSVILSDIGLAFPERNSIQDNTYSQQTTPEQTECDKNSVVLSDIATALPENNHKQSGTNNQNITVVQAASDKNSNFNAVKNPDFHLEELIEHYFKPEILEGNNKYQCCNCGSLQNAMKSVKITCAPNHLILHLLRFSYCSETNALHKNCANIKYPKTLVINSHNDLETVQNIYSLYAVIVHYGTSSDCGHYYSYIRRLNVRSSCSVDNIVTGDDDLFADEWYLFNDENVSSSSFEYFGSSSRQGPNETAYMLFYCNSSTFDRAEDVCKDIPISTLLVDTIVQDNKVLQEEEQKESGENRSKGSYVVSRVSGRENNDDDEPPPQGGSNCGSGNLYFTCNVTRSPLGVAVKMLLLIWHLFGVGLGYYVCMSIETETRMGMEKDIYKRLLIISKHDSMEDGDPVKIKEVIFPWAVGVTALVGMLVMVSFAMMYCNVKNKGLKAENEQEEKEKIEEISLFSGFMFIYYIINIVFIGVTWKRYLQIKSDNEQKTEKPYSVQMNEYGSPSPRGSVTNATEDLNRSSISPQNFYSDPPSGNYPNERAIRYSKYNDHRLSVCHENSVRESDMYSDGYAGSERRGSYNDRKYCYDNPSMSQDIVWSEPGRSEDCDASGRSYRYDYPCQDRYDNKIYANTPNNGGMRRPSYYSREPPRKLSSYANSPSLISNETDDSVTDHRYRRRSECPPPSKVTNERRKSAYFTGMYRYLLNQN